MIKTLSATVLMVGITAFAAAAQQQAPSTQAPTQTAPAAQPSHTTAPHSPAASDRTEMRLHAIRDYDRMREYDKMREVRRHNMNLHGWGYWDNHHWRGSWHPQGHWMRCAVGPYHQCWAW